MYLHEWFSNSPVKWKASLWNSKNNNTSFRIQLDINKTTWNISIVNAYTASFKSHLGDTKKLLPVLTLERGLGRRAAVERGEGHLPCVTLLHKECVWVLSAQLKINKICNQKKEREKVVGVHIQCVFFLLFLFNWNKCTAPLPTPVSVMRGRVYWTILNFLDLNE